MWVDVIIAVILVYTIIQGFRHGFVHTFIHTIGWLLAVVLGFVWYPYVIDFLKDKTDFYDSVHAKIAERFSENAGSATNSLLESLPRIIRELFTEAFENATNAMASSFADSLSIIIFNIIGFLVVVIGIKLILLFFTSLFSKKSNDGFVGGLDGLLGLVAGGVKGLVIVYILLALMVPITSLSGSTMIIEELEGSVIGSYLYDNNLILEVIDR